MSTQPSGTVTFLFTDIEGSTRLWEEQPEAMRHALAGHDTLMRRAIEAHNGSVFKTVGDAFCAAFHTAPEALAAALDMQLVLQNVSPSPLDETQRLQGSEPYARAAQETAPALRVRMALHTGSCEQRDGDYFGPPLNRVARLLAIGHGSQVLLSDVTHELIRDSLPPTAGLLDMGPHRLKDLQRPEQVFQLLYPGLLCRFPPLRSLDNIDLPNNLPRQLSSFVGREREIAEVKTLLRKTRLLTLMGSGGCGKTRLSLQVAADVLEECPDGVWFIELAPLADSMLVPQTIASVLSLKEEAGKTITQTLSDFLRSRRLLLILDNCEHLIDACARLADTLLRNCTYLTLLASSREGLGVAGEMTYRVPSLSLPDPKRKASVESLSQYEAVRLFVERAIFHNSQFTVTNDNAPALAQLCIQLDGIPLALELAAARVRALSVEEINHKLDNRFRLLTSGSRTALPRQQTLRAAVDWSYDLLNEQEKALLCRLSVFAGGWTLPAAETVGAGDGIEDWEVLDLLTSLVDKSLAVFEEHRGKTRYHLLETMRRYGQEHLEKRGEVDAVARRHRDVFLALAVEARPHMDGVQQGVWLECMEAEHDNLRTAMSFRQEDAAGRQASLELVAALQLFWDALGYWNEGRERLQEALAKTEGFERIPARADALLGAGHLAQLQGDYAAARSFKEESLQIYQELGDRWGMIRALNALGSVALPQGDYQTAQSLFERSLTISRELNDEIGIVWALNNLGSAALQQGDYAAARSSHEESLAIGRKVGDERGVAIALNDLGNVALQQGDLATAQAFYEETLTLYRKMNGRAGTAWILNLLGRVALQQGDCKAAISCHTECLAIYNELGNKWGVALARRNLGSVAYSQGDYGLAKSLHEESLTAYRELGDSWSIAHTLVGMAHLAAGQGQAERAARLYGAVETLCEHQGMVLYSLDRNIREQDMLILPAQMGAGALAAAWNDGCQMTLEQAMDYALEEQIDLFRA